jgi:hypothetical protein
MVYRQILLDSASSYDVSKPTFNLQSPFFVDRFKVLSAQIPNSFYSTGNTNNQIAFKEETTTYYAQLNPGFYNASSMPEEMARAMNATPSTNGYSVTYNEDTKSLTITGTNAFTVLGNDQGTTAWNSIGARKVGVYPTGTSVTLGVADFTGISSLLLVSSQLISRDNMFLGNENISVLAYIPCSSHPGSVIQWTNPGSYLFYGSDLSYLELRLLDSATLREVDLNGNPFQVTLGVLTDNDDPVMMI